uniref:Serpin domain-containing protein n=1 Tax=Neogobius melanostomus TaxID=47308 RepID=A0A8C6WJ95_9GOBI
MSPFFTILIRSITALYFFNAFAADTAASGNLCKANTTFTLDLFKSLGGKDKTSNVFFSPLSISSALSMLLLGAKGSTAKQMREVGSFKLHFLIRITQIIQTTDVGRNVHSSFAALLQELNKPDSSYALGVANRLYGDIIKDVLDSLTIKLHITYQAKLRICWSEMQWIVPLSWCW